MKWKITITNEYYSNQQTQSIQVWIIRIVSIIHLDYFKIFIKTIEITKLLWIRFIVFSVDLNPPSIGTWYFLLSQFHLKYRGLSRIIIMGKMESFATGIHLAAAVCVHWSSFHQRPLLCAYDKWKITSPFCFVI